MRRCNLNKYQILVEAKLDPIESEKSITKDFGELAKKVVFTIKNLTVDKSSLTGLRTQIEDALKGLPITIAGGASNPAGGGAGGSSGGIAVPSATSSTPSNSNLIGVQNTFNADGKNVARVEEYRQSIVETIKVVSRWDQTAGDLIVTQTKENENLQKGIDFNTKLSATYAQLAVAQERLKLSPVSANSGLPQPQAIQNVVTAINEYQNAINRVSQSGGVASKQDIQNLKEMEVQYNNAINELKLYEGEESARISQINQETQAIKILSGEYQNIASIQNTIDNSRLKKATGDTDPEVQQIQALQEALAKYKALIDSIAQNGNIVTESDKQKIAEARVQLTGLNSELEKEESLLKMIADANIKNNQETAKATAETQKQVETATALAGRIKAMMTDRDSANPTVVKAKEAYDNLLKSIDDVNKAQGQNASVMTEAKGALDKASDSAKNAAVALGTVGKNAQGWWTEINIAIKRTIEWASAMTLLYGSLRQIQAGIQYVQDLNKELVNIQVVTGATNSQVAMMAEGFNKLANELGATTQEVARGSLEWYRQGKTAEETALLLRNSTMMAKLANLDAAQSTEYLTSIMNGFQLNAKDMAGVIDQLVGLDNAYATSVG